MAVRNKHFSRFKNGLLHSLARRGKSSPPNEKGFLSVSGVYNGWVDRLLQFVEPREPASRSYRYLARRIEQDLAHKGTTRLLAFTSPDAAELTTDALLMFACSLQDELGCRVLLVDATFRKEGLSGRLGCAAAPGLMDLLYSGRYQPDDLIQPTAKRDISVLPAGGAPQDGFLPLNPERIQPLLTTLSGRFDYILIQHGSILKDTRYLLFAKLVDLIVLLVEEGGTLVTELESCQKLFRSHGLGNVRLVLSKPDKLKLPLAGA